MLLLVCKVTVIKLHLLTSVHCGDLRYVVANSFAFATIHATFPWLLVSVIVFWRPRSVSKYVFEIHCRLRVAMLPGICFAEWISTPSADTVNPLINMICRFHKGSHYVFSKDLFALEIHGGPLDACLCNSEEAVRVRDGGGRWSGERHSVVLEPATLKELKTRLYRSDGVIIEEICNYVVDVAHLSLCKPMPWWLHTRLHGKCVLCVNNLFETQTSIL